MPKPPTRCRPRLSTNVLACTRRRRHPSAQVIVNQRMQDRLSSEDSLCSRTIEAASTRIAKNSRVSRCTSTPRTHLVIASLLWSPGAATVSTAKVDGAKTTRSADHVAVIVTYSAAHGRTREHIGQRFVERLTDRLICRVLWAVNSNFAVCPRFPASLHIAMKKSIWAQRMRHCAMRCSLRIPPSPLDPSYRSFSLP